jgi:AraC-like DNA-binding protein
MVVVDAGSILTIVNSNEGSIGHNRSALKLPEEVLTTRVAGVWPQTGLRSMTGLPASLIETPSLATIPASGRRRPVMRASTLPVDGASAPTQGFPGRRALRSRLGMDALSDVLRVMRLRGGVFLEAEFRDPWCVSLQVQPDICGPYLGDTSHLMPYHFVVEGRMRVRLTDGLEFEMEAGEAVLFPHNDVHLMGSDLTRPPASCESLVRRATDGGLSSLASGGDGTSTRMICGYLGADDIAGNPIIGALPEALRIDVRDSPSADWIRSMFGFASERIAKGFAGSEVIMSKLSELLFVEAVQRYTEDAAGERSGWFAGLRDPYVSKALALMHRSVGAPWTVESLSREIGLSRSALATRFSDLLGMAPMQYLTHWRIQAAGHDLLNTNKSILQVAREVGYESEASFTRAFKRMMGAPPAAWRRQRRSS